LNFLGTSFEKYANIKLMKIRPVGDELFHTDRQTDEHDENKGRFFFLAILQTRLKT